MKPSIFFGTQTSLADGVPPEQVHFERTERQSEAHPIPSVQSPSSQTSRPFRLLFPQTSQTLKGFVISHRELASI